MGSEHSKIQFLLDSSRAYLFLFASSTGKIAWDCPWGSLIWEERYRFFVLTIIVFICQIFPSHIHVEACVAFTCRFGLVAYRLCLFRLILWHIWLGTQHNFRLLSFTTQWVGFVFYFRRQGIESLIRFLVKSLITWCLKTSHIGASSVTCCSCHYFWSVFILVLLDTFGWLSVNNFALSLCTARAHLDRYFIIIILSLSIYF